MELAPMCRFSRNALKNSVARPCDLTSDAMSPGHIVAPGALTITLPPGVFVGFVSFAAKFCELAFLLVFQQSKVLIFRVRGHSYY